MSEYVSIDPEPTDDPDVMRLVTNLDLTPDGGPEVYASRIDGDEGSPLAQALFDVPGLAALRIDGTDLVAHREPGVMWPALVEDLSDALRDFFL